jgi:mono/diheme cytochrome c family protein
MKKASSIVCSFLFILGPMALGSRLGASQTEPAMPDNVKAVFKERCAVCHKGKYPPKLLNLEPGGLPASFLNEPSREQPALKIVDTTSPEASYLLKKIKGSEGIKGKHMPPPGKTALSAEEIALVENWIIGLKEGRPAISFRELGFGFGGFLASSAPIQAPADKSKKAKPAYEKPPFWGTRLVNLPTGMTMDKGDFLFRISHRLVPSVRTGYDTAWGLDGPAMAFLSLGYGITDRIGATVGRSGLFKEIEFSSTWLVLEQGENASLPFSFAVNGGLSWVTQKQEGRGAFNSRNFKINAQVILSRQFNERLSVLVAPIYSSNTKHWEADSQGTFSIGIGGRFMFLEDLSLIGEWVPVLAGYKDIANGWGFGIEKKIGGHVFQFFVTDSIGLTSAQFVTGGDLRLGKGDLRIGFNIFRTF